MPIVFPIAYFGSISYYKDVISKSSIEFEIQEHFVKQSIRNRSRILTANGSMELSIPVIKPNGSKTLTKDILILNSNDWRKDHWRAIESAYKHAAYFDHYGEEIKSLIYQETKDLIGFNLNIMDRIQKWLDLPYYYSLTSDFSPINEINSDFRFGFTQHPFQNEYKYFQVFQDKMSFVGDLSILDAILNLGPMARNIFITTNG